VAQGGWRAGKQIRTLAGAAGFVREVGFALLFPSGRLDLPSLYEVGRDPTKEGGWGPDMARVWGWKDQLPAKGLAWGGRFLLGLQCVLAPDLLADLYPGRGEPDDFGAFELSPPARETAERLLVEGPLPTAAMRKALGLPGSQFAKVQAELGRLLLVTHLGTDDSGPGWPSVVLELTARAFDVPSAGDETARRRRAAARFVATMGPSEAAELARAFGWRRADAQAALAALRA